MFINCSKSLEKYTIVDNFLTAKPRSAKNQNQSPARQILLQLNLFLQKLI